MSKDTPICALCGTALTHTHQDDLDSWVCPTGHGLAVTPSEASVVGQEDELARLWERGRSAAAGIRRCPMCETAMAVVSLGVDDERREGDTGDGPAPATVKVDLCGPCQVLWFDSDELAAMLDSTCSAGPASRIRVSVGPLLRLADSAA